MKALTLAEALASDRLEEFIAQAEAETGPIDPAEFEARLASLITAPPQEDQTSRSRARGDSRGTQTR